MDPVSLINKLIDRKKMRLVESGPKNRLIAVIALVRIMDDFIFGVKLGSIKKDGKIKLFTSGWDMILNTFYVIDPNDDNMPPLFPISKEQHVWGLSVLSQFGELGYLQLYIDYYLTGLVDITVTGTEINITYLTKNTGVELVERDDILWYQEFLHEKSKNKHAYLIEKSQEIHEKMKESVQLADNYFLSYTNLPEIDDFYLNLAFRDLECAFGIDFFPPDTQFGGVELRTYIKGLAVLISLSTKHIGFVSNLLVKGEKANGVNLVQQIILKKEAIEHLSEYFEGNKDFAIRVLELLTLDDQNSRYKIDGATSPIIKVSTEHLLFSYSGFMGQPVLFLLSELRRNYQIDWDRALNIREEIFRKQIYDLFNNERYIKIDRSIVIKHNRKILTDIDGLIFDRQTGVLGLFQLKWQEPFASSMFERASRKKNFEHESIEWINAVYRWINNLSSEELGSHLGIKKSKLVNWNDTKLFILGRHFSHFSGANLPDDRAAWGMWPQVLRLVNEANTTKDLSLLSWLYSSLKKDSPIIKAEQNSEQFTDYSWSIDKYQINVMRSHLQK